MEKTNVMADFSIRKEIIEIGSLHTVIAIVDYSTIFQGKKIRW